MTHPTFEEEQLLWDKGFTHVIGIDEVGRGAFAGPVVAAAVTYPPNFSSTFLRRVNDSKLLKPRERESLCSTIQQNALLWAISEVDVSFINKFGIGKANIKAFRNVLKNILLHKIPYYFILIDGFHGKYLPGGLKKQKAIIKGDQKSISIASASILAKVYRDKLMLQYSRKFKHYFFGTNKGYGTKLHQRALFEHGISPIHRTSFNLQKFLE